MPQATPGAVRLSRLAAAATYRVAMVAACPFPSLRGSQVLIRELAERLAAAGHAVHVVTYSTAQHIVPVDRIAIHRVPKLPGLWTAHPLGWQKLILDLLLVYQLYRVVRRERIQVIHAHNFEGPVIAYLVRLLTGVPVVYHAHNALTDELPCYFRSSRWRRTARRIGAAIDRRVAAWADCSIALSDRLGAFLAVRGAAGRVTVVPPAVGMMRGGDPAPARSKSEPVIMYAGNLDPYQDLQLLLDAFERVRLVLPSARLIIVTHEATGLDATQRVAGLGARAGVSVRVVPTFAAALGLLRRADVVVCPRSSWSGFPIKVLNYMSLGRPIVHARASAHPIRHGVSGLLFDDGDAAALASQVVRLVEDPALAARLGRQARVTVRQRHAWPRVLPRVVEVYRRVVEERRRADRTRSHQSDTETVMNGTDDSSRTPVSLANRAPFTFGALLVLSILCAGLIAGCSSSNATPAPLPPLDVPVVPGVGADNPLYRLQPGDTLEVNFTYHEELNSKVAVRPDGTVSVPGVGELTATGKTADELAKDVQQLSSDRLRDPEVTVVVSQVGVQKVYVSGEVRIPGFVLFREGMTPLQAIMDRGGFTDVAQTNSVLHLKVRDQTYVATKLDLSKAIEGKDPQVGVLAANDMVYVPRNFIGDANAFVKHYIRDMLPIEPRVGFSPLP